MENNIFSTEERIGRLIKFKIILKKIVEANNMTNSMFYELVKANAFYMYSFLEGKNPNFPNESLLKRIADNSKGITTFEELVEICGCRKTEYSKIQCQNIRRGDIYFADLGNGIGSEQQGERPVLVLQNDAGNKHAPTIIVTSISSKLTKTNLPTHVLIDEQCGLNKTSVVLLEQIRTIDKKRLLGYVGHISLQDSKKIDKAFKISGGLWNVEDELMESLDRINDTEVSIFKKALNVLVNKLKNRELQYNY